MTGFFRKFIPRFSEITEPLTLLTRKDKKFEWNAEQQAAFEKLRDALASEPVLGFPDYDAPFHIFCDASAVAQGAALMQTRPGSEKDYYAIAYASRTISDPETRWPAIQVELGAIIFALRQFRPYCYDISIIHIDGKKNTVADCLSRARENDEPAEYTELKDIIEFPVCMKVQPGTPQTNRTLVVKRNQPTSVLDITKEQDGDPDILVIKKVLQGKSSAESIPEHLSTRLALSTLAANGTVITKPSASSKRDVLYVPKHLTSLIFEAFHESLLSGGHFELEVEEVEVEEVEAEEKSQDRGEVETHPPAAQIDFTDLPAEAIVRMMELPAHMITSEVHPFASSHVEPIKKMDPPDSAAKRMAYYCTLDMIQAGRNRSITDARIINEARPTLKRIRRENLQTIDFWPNHADGALPYVLRNRDGRRWWAVPLFAETVADDWPDLHMVILDVFANDLGNGDRIDINDYLFGDIILITSFMALPNSRLADIVSTFDNIHRTESHRFLAVKELYLLKREFSETQVIQIPLRAPRGNVFCVARGQTLHVTALTNLFIAKGIKNEPGAKAIASLFHPQLHPGQFLKSILEDDYATILQRTNGHLNSDPTPPSVVTIKHLSRRDAEYFDAMPQPFRRFNADKSTRSPCGIRLRRIYRNFGRGLLPILTFTNLLTLLIVDLFFMLQLV
uniref:RNA-directed DNA polymerase n=1 Tax=Caenorhabditis japonica TaxID=281687 RepID=A0A8R1DKW6_CAEJA